MAYTYLTLTNDVCKRLNEVELTSSNFASATGQHSQIKDAVNYAIKDINQFAYYWPFNHNDQSDTLVAGTNTYALQSNCKVVDWNSFRIQKDDSLSVETRPLQLLTYKEYIQKGYVDHEYNTSTGIRTVPTHVVRTPDQEYALYPVPDKAYTLDYEYYSIPADLSAYTDVPTIPEQFRKVIVDGAMYYCYMFRGDVENTQFAEQHFKAGLKAMRSQYINRYEYANSTMITRQSSGIDVKRII